MNKKYKDIIDSAKSLFWKYGFKKVSIELICKNAHVSKMTFYKFFPNKIELAKTVFENEVRKSVIVFREILAEKNPLAITMQKILLLKIQGTNDISQEFIQDFYTSSEPELKSYVENLTRDIWKEMLQEFKNGQDIGIFRKDFKPEVFFALSQKTPEIITDSNLLKLFDKPQDLIMELANLLVYGISGKQ